MVFEWLEVEISSRWIQATRQQYKATIRYWDEGIVICQSRGTL
jgi:hypothetical protein